MQKNRGFTLLELLTVMTIIVVLAAIVLNGIGYAQRKAASERAIAEIAAIGAALESYKIDNGDYPRTTEIAGNIPISPTDGKMGSVKKYEEPGKQLYRALHGWDIYGKIEDDEGNPLPRGQIYFDAKIDMLANYDPKSGFLNINLYMIDPFGNPYGYSLSGTFNPTFDLWSTSGMTQDPSPSDKAPPVGTTWNKNW